MLPSRSPRHIRLAQASWGELRTPSATESILYNGDTNNETIRKQLQEHRLRDLPVGLAPFILGAVFLKWDNAGMRITVTLDDQLVATALKYTGLTKKSALVKAAVEHLVQREAARYLANLGGTMPNLKRIPRRRLK